MYLMLYHPTRWCASLVPQTNTALNTLRTSWHECVTSVSLFCSRKVSLLEVFLPLFPTIWSQHTVMFKHKRPCGLHTDTPCVIWILCLIKLLHVAHFCSPGEQAVSTAISPGSRATFAFSRRQKRIPAALKEVSVVFVLIRMHCC